MAIRLPSLVQVASTLWSGDTALDLPDLHRYYDTRKAKAAERAELQRKGLSEGELADAIKKQEAEVEALRLKCDDDLRKLTVSRETGDYSKILKAGEPPTWFKFRIIPGTLMREFQNELITESIANFKIPALAFRIALVGIDGLDGVRVDMEDDKHYGRIAKSDIVDSLDAIDAGIVNELGNFALSRSFPKAV